MNRKNKLGRWHDIRKVLPVPDRLVLLDLGERRYRIAVLSQYNREEEIDVIFTTDENDSLLTILTERSEVVRWAYIEIENY